MPLFSFTNIPWTPVITTFIHHQSCFFQGPQISRQFWCTGMQRSSKAQTAAVWLLYLCKTPSLSTSSKWNMSYWPSTAFWFDRLLTLSLDTVFTKSTNNQSLKMTAPPPCNSLLVCGTGIYVGSFAHPLYGELKHLFNRCDSRANCTHSARAFLTTKDKGVGDRLHCIHLVRCLLI